MNDIHFFLKKKKIRQIKILQFEQISSDTITSLGTRSVCGKKDNQSLVQCDSLSLPKKILSAEQFHLTQKQI